MNILVTGCAGFIGSSVCEQLLVDEKNFIIGIDNFDNYYPRYIKEKNIESFINESNFTIYENSICDIKSLKNIFNSHKIDLVIHLAAKAGVRNSFVFPKEYKMVNVDGTLNILECMKEFGVKKMVFASSSSVYGNYPDVPFKEEYKNLKQISPYAKTKKDSEEIIERYTKNTDISAICLRFFTVYGKRQRPDLAICKFVNSIINNQTIELYGDGNTQRDYTYIDDIVSGIILAVKYNKTKFEVINLGSSSPVKLIDMVNSIENILNKKANIKYVPAKEGDVVITFADITKARRLLNYEPQTSFYDGLSKFIKYFLETGEK